MSTLSTLSTLRMLDQAHHLVENIDAQIVEINL